MLITRSYKRKRKVQEKRRKFKEKADLIFWGIVSLVLIGVMFFMPVGYFIFIIISGDFFTLGGFLGILFIFFIGWGGLYSILSNHF